MNTGFSLCGQICPQSQLQKGKHNFALLELAFFRQKRKPAKGQLKTRIDASHWTMDVAPRTITQPIMTYWILCFAASAKF